MWILEQPTVPIDHLLLLLGICSPHHSDTPPLLLPQTHPLLSLTHHGVVETLQALILGFHPLAIAVLVALALH